MNGGRCACSTTRHSAPVPSCQVYGVRPAKRLAGCTDRHGVGTGDETVAARYFRLLGAPPGAGAAADFRQHDRDGMQNQHVSGSYRTASSAAATLDHYRAATRRIGLTVLPSAETRTCYPAALCDGPVVVTVTPQCAGSRCDVFAEVVG